MTPFAVSTCEQSVAIKCPALANPPPSVTIALRKAAQGDEKAKAWIIKFAKHYDKLDACKA